VAEGGVLNGRSEGVLVSASWDVFGDCSRFSEDLGVVWDSMLVSMVSVFLSFDG